MSNYVATVDLNERVETGEEQTREIRTDHRNMSTGINRKG